MPRPKVPDHQRRRTAEACGVCKRRKQKCDGLQPCQSCIKNNFICDYSQVGSSDASRRSTRARTSTAKQDYTGKAPPPRHDLNVPAHRADLGIRQLGNGVEAEEEADVVDPRIRMLQDPAGRLLFVGESASLSYLQSIRMIVEFAIGKSEFTLDPERHRIKEPILQTIITSPSKNVPFLLPEKRVASVLLKSYFINTAGLMELFDHQALEQSLDACYSCPSSVYSSGLCIIYLTLAIGLVMASPGPSGAEHAAISGVSLKDPEAAEAFYAAATGLCKNVNELADADMWSIQVLCLMSVYMLTASKRNAAYGYHGMAVRSAFALGLHDLRRQEEEHLFGVRQAAVRRNLWRSLFILDRFLAASLGRPMAISEDDCLEESLQAPPAPATGTGPSSIFEPSHSHCLDGAVQACRVIGQILKKIYCKRKISASTAQEISGRCDWWARSATPNADSRQIFGQAGCSPSQKIAMFHLLLLECHTIILLTRPFFLYRIITSEKARRDAFPFGSNGKSKLGKFSEMCVSASVRTINLVQAAHESRYVPRQNPFVSYFLFSATLILLSHEFARKQPEGEQSMLISQAINIVEYCAETDVQAQRLRYILRSFRAAIRKPDLQGADEGPSLPPIHALLPRGSDGPMPSISRPEFYQPPYGLKHTSMAVPMRNEDNSPGAGSSGDSSGFVPINRDVQAKNQPVSPLSWTGNTVGAWSETGPGASTASSIHSRRLSTQSIGVKEEFGTERSDLPGSDQEIDFDYFWDIRRWPAPRSQGAPGNHASAGGAGLEAGQQEVGLEDRSIAGVYCSSCSPSWPQGPMMAATTIRAAAAAAAATATAAAAAVIVTPTETPVCP